MATLAEKSSISKINDSGNVITRDSLDWRDIESIASGKLLAVRVPGFYPKSECIKATLRLKNSKKIESYDAAPDISKIGKAIFDVVNNPEMLQTYYEEAPVALKELRESYAPNISPMDLLRLHLQETWPAGSNLENLHGQLVFCGLTRLFNEESEALPHQDMTHWDVHDSLAAWSQITQLAVNIYLELPQSGGALELWDTGFKTQDDYKKHMDKDSSYGLDREKIPTSSIVIYPEVGELIIFNARNIHAVKKIKSGSRLTSSCFIGYRGVTQPLTVYS